MFRSALIGGAIAGVLSSIPCLSLGCCLWGLGGGLLAAYFSSRTGNMSTGEGVKVGAIAGAIAGFISGILNSLMQIALQTSPFKNIPPEQAEKLPEFLRGGGGTGMVVAVMFVMCVGILVVTGLLGGLIGGAVFKPKVGGATPPAPAV
jgi:hypothetical protein